MTRRALVLASKSPRRAELLKQIGLEFSTSDADIDESVMAGEDVETYVRRLARSKAEAGWAASSLCIAADTAVALDDEIFGKPHSREAGVTMLLRLAGRAHQVLTGVCLFDGTRAEVIAVVSTVWFRHLSETEALAYWSTGEPKDKAGGYGVQGVGAVFIDRIEGSYSNIVGLPIAETEAMLQRFDIDTWAMRTNV